MFLYNINKYKIIFLRKEVTRPLLLKCLTTFIFELHNNSINTASKEEEVPRIYPAC